MSTLNCNHFMEGSLDFDCFCLNEIDAVIVFLTDLEISVPFFLIFFNG